MVWDPFVHYFVRSSFAVRWGIPLFDERGFFYPSAGATENAVTVRERAALLRGDE
jgi:hypothetical protein